MNPQKDPIFQLVNEENTCPIPGMMSTPKSAKSAGSMEACENKLIEKSFSVLEQVSHNRKKLDEVEDADAIFGKHIV